MGGEKQAVAGWKRFARWAGRELLLVVGLVLFAISQFLPVPQARHWIQSKGSPIFVYRVDGGFYVHLPGERVDLTPAGAQPLERFMELEAIRETTRREMVESLTILPLQYLPEHEQAAVLAALAAAFDRCPGCEADLEPAPALARAGVWERRERYWMWAVRDASFALSVVAFIAALVRHGSERRRRLEADLTERGGPCRKCGYSGTGLAGAACPSCGNSSSAASE